MLGEEEHKLGIRASSTRQVFFNDTVVPIENMLSERGKGFKIALNSLNVGRIKLGAACLDASRRIITESVNYGNERQQFKTAISNFGAIQKKYAEMSAKTFTLDASKVYLYKQVEVNPYYKLYNADQTYEKINQGVFYLDNWSSSEYGDISLTALDGAKILQEVIAPSIICEGYSTTAILRRLLDTVGFVNYKFNMSATDTSIFTPKFFKVVKKSCVPLIKTLNTSPVMTNLFRSMVDENNI